MGTPNIIAVGILIVVVIAIIGIRIYMNSKKQNKNMTFDDFIDLYGDQILEVLQDTAMILQININEFPNRDEYEKAIINTTIDKLKENAKDLGINKSIINLFDTEALTEVVYKVFNSDTEECFIKLTNKQIIDNKDLYKPEVVSALTVETE